MRAPMRRLSISETFTSTMTIADIITAFERLVPTSLQESYDNSGLQAGNTDRECRGALAAIDVTEAVLEEALRLGCNLVVTHHPLLFHALKRISSDTYIERCVAFALKHDLVIYSAHTSLDNSPLGPNAFWARQMHLRDTQVLEPREDYYYKVATYLPVADAPRMRDVLRRAGAGRQGEYSGCSFSVAGEGRFVPSSEAHPHCGERGEWHVEPEERISVLADRGQLPEVLSALRAAHPYEEPAIDVVPVQYSSREIGAGIIGTLPRPMTLEEVVEEMAAFQPVTHVAHSRYDGRAIERVAFCSGAGASLYRRAGRMGADLFLTGEAKYNDFYDATDYTVLAAYGHYESELMTQEILGRLLSEKIGTFAVHYSANSANPVNYLERQNGK